jgi:hypothetical protein
VTAPQEENGSASDEDWRQTVEGLWTEIARTREDLDAQRRRRGEAPTTNKEIAEAIGISDRTLGDWFRKRCVVPDWYDTRKIVEYLGGDAGGWQPRWERAKAAYDSRPRGRTSRSTRNGEGNGAEFEPDRHARQNGSAGTAAVRTGSPGAPEPLERPADPPPGRRRRRVGTVMAVAAAVLVLAVVTGWLITSRDDRTPTAAPSPSSSPSVPAWQATIVNTWSDKQSKDVGVYRYKSPLRAEWELPGYLGGNVVSITCQYRKGRTITDDRTHTSSAVWDRTVDGGWVPDLYTNLPKVAGTVPPLGIPACADVT